MNTSLTPVIKFAGQMVNALLREMQRGLNRRELLDTPEWAVLFGNRQSMVVNLLKLIQSLATLNTLGTKHAEASEDYQQEDVLSDQDARILSAWLNEERSRQDT